MREIETKIVHFNEYKKRKRRCGLTVFEFYGILINTLLTTSICIFLSYLMFLPGEEYSLRNWFATGVFLLGIFHLFKMYRLFKEKKIQEGIDDLWVIVITTAVCFGIFSLISWDLAETSTYKMSLFFIGQFICIPHIILSMKLAKKNNKIDKK